MLNIYLALAVLAVPVGTMIAFISKGKRSYFGIIFGLTAGAVLSIVLKLMVDLYGKSGLAAVAVMWLGFLLIFLVEWVTPRLSKSVNKNGHQKTEHVWVVNVTLVGLAIHSLVDGFNLATAAKGQALLALAVLVHRLPVAVVMAFAFLRHYTLGSTLIRLTPLMLGPLVGVLIGARLLQGVFNELTEYLTAFAAGTLLHVVMDSGRGTVSATEKLGFTIAFIIAFILTTIYFFPGFSILHAH
jgi:zinc transporter ZupT